MKDIIKVKMKKALKDNEIELIRRTKENYTHRVLEDHNIKEITLWKVSQKKIIIYYILNIFSFGITYFISRHKIEWFIKFICLPCTIKEADYFLIKDIYDTLKLCPKETRRITQTQNGLSDDLPLENILNNNNLNNQLIGFNYNSQFYEYNETKNKMVPNFFNLSILTNKRIYQLFIEGHTTLNRVKKFTERYGPNICKFDYKLINLYFWKAEFFLLIMGIVLAMIEGYCGSRAYLVFLTLFSILTAIIQQIINKRLSFDKDDTLDGKKKKIKVKRRYISQENSDYCFIDNIDLLPGDIIYLTKGDEVPCDGVILEGECILGNSMVNGSINEINKKALDNNSFNFNYELNNPSILFHGSKLIKTYSKLENNSILVLALNTGSNTFKANQLANIRYLFRRNNSYNEIYSKFCGKKNTLFFHGLFMAIIGFAVSLIIFFKKFEGKFDLKLIKLLLNILSRSFFPSFHVVCSGIIFLGAIYLSWDNIKCFDKSRLLYAGSVNTIFFDKTGTLTEKYLDIGGLFPVSFNQNSSEPTIKYYNLNQIKDLNGVLIDYYTEFQKKKNNLKNDIYFKNNYMFSKYEEQQREKSAKSFQKKLMVLFMECMVSCNTLEKKNNQIAGNGIEKEIFKHVKWEIKAINAKDDSKEFSNGKTKKEENEEDILDNTFANTNFDNKTINSRRTIPLDDDCKIRINEEIMNIYPNSYYKITEGKILDNKKKISLNEIININNKKENIYETIDESSRDDVTREYSDYISKDRNQRQDFYKTKEKVYFLRIFRRFIRTGTLYSSALVYNTITDSVNFFIKGAPEEILPYCNPNYLPKDIYRIINTYRRNGFINLILAGRELDNKEDDQVLNEDYYKDDLVFYGLIILKNKLKKDVKIVMEELKTLNCDIILNTGDNIYNSIAVGYESGIIHQKNIFQIDLNKNTRKLIVSTFNDLTKERKTSTIKNDKFTIRNLEKVSNKKSDLQNFKQKLALKLGDFMKNKKPRILNKENKENNDKKMVKDSRRNLDNIIDKPNPTNFTNFLFKSLRLPVKNNININSDKNIPSKFEISKENTKENNNLENKENISNKNNNNKLESTLFNNINPINQSINSKTDFIDKVALTSIENTEKEKNIMLLSSEPKDSLSNKILNTMPPQERPVDSFSKANNKNRPSAVFPPFSEVKNETSINSEIKANKRASPPISFAADSIKKNIKFKPLEPSLSFNFTKENTKRNNDQNSNEYFPLKLKHMRTDCLYCVSGRALRFIFLNRHNPDYKKLELPILLNHIKKFGKIFYEMSSRDKSLIIDIFRKMPNKITCMVGDGQNDLDAIMTAHVGINLNQPVNNNTVLSHFYPTDGSLFCIAKIIRYGRVIYENIYLLGISSFLCALTIVITMIILYYYEIKFVTYELDFMSCNYFLLSIFAFSIKPDETIESCFLFHNPTLFKIFFMVISLLFLIIDAVGIFLFIYFYSKNEELDKEKANDIFGTYIYFMCYIQTLGMMVTINSINFYRKNYRNNFCFWICMIILIFFVCFIFCIFGYSIHPVLSDYLSFEYNPKNVDTFDDKNKLVSYAIFLLSIIVYYLFVTLIFFLFRKKAENDYKKSNKLLISNKKEE